MVFLNTVKLMVSIFSEWSPLLFIAGANEKMDGSDRDNYSVFYFACRCRPDGRSTERCSALSVLNPCGFSCSCVVR